MKKGGKKEVKGGWRDKGVIKRVEGRRGEDKIERKEILI